MGFLFVLKRIGFMFVDHWRIVVIGLALLVVIIASMFTYRSCQRSKAKLDEQQTIKAQQAIETHNDEKLKQILAEADTRDDNIDLAVKQAEENTRQAKKKYDNLSSEELAKELESRK